MLNIDKYFEAEGKAEKARKRCLKRRSKKKFNRHLRRWLKAELTCALLKGDNATLPVARALKQYTTRKQMMSTTMDLYMLRHQLVWTH